jgi:sterol desaturase/sphingolipid hydroxylase (fatty acid hydroxylase superfamily)
MEEVKIDHSEEPIRLFKSDFLEFFTHIHPAVVIAIWLPVGIYALVRGFLDWPGEQSLGWILVAFLIGLFLWTLTEYLLHRFLFHFRARNEAQRKIFFLFHGVHHAQPQCKTRLVMPPVVSIPMALIFYYLFSRILGGLFQSSFWVGPTFSGFILGYLTYDLTHYATHHFPMRTGIWKTLKRHHMRHHFKNPNRRFGVSSPLWDYVFRTMGD